MTNHEVSSRNTTPKTNRSLCDVFSEERDPPKLWLQHPEGFSNVLEKFRTFRNKLLSQTSGESKKVLTLTGAQKRVGTSTVAFNLGLSFALEMAQEKILVVDANFRRPVLHQMFAIAQCPGLQELLLNTATLQDVACDYPSLPGLTLIAAGDTTAKRAPVFPTNAFVAFIQEVKAAYDVVIIDTAPVLQSGQADMIASHSDGTILVVQASRTRSEVVGAAVNQLNNSGATLLGSFLNKRKYVIPAWLYHYV
ncbi:CpsD/CapB family tyrosine-protein kinase [Desulfosarcina ovata]|uniref:non-specific protein-tyrosine kinase n=1 Tax=Desulfosarcina ovata subsp. ovata TaxID=2752305 RepID=A0A5K8A5P5_9BACT|nr:CpsD/CapB family tyrosine-protein kinase [Desulfosarcina ovata]BBO87708.1 exopolysaccharide biosynthesis protein [Desulfosarcina ovata subsp. ovata]